MQASQPRRVIAGVSVVDRAQLTGLSSLLGREGTDGLQDPVPARLATATAALGLVFMGAIVEPVFLVPALTVVLALGLWAEARPVPLTALPVPWRTRPALDIPAGATMQPVNAVVTRHPAGGAVG